MKHEEYKEWVDAGKEADYLVEYANCTREEADALIEGEMRYVNSSLYEENLETFADKPHGLNLAQFVEAAVWSFEIEAAMACTCDGKPAFASCFVSRFIQDQPDINLSYEKAADLISAQFPLLWDEEAEKNAIRHRFSQLHEGDHTHFGRDTIEEGDPYRNLWWDVLVHEDDRVLLVSSYVIDCRPYDVNLNPLDAPFEDDFFEGGNYDGEALQVWLDKCSQFAPTTWESCDLRAWLNGEFLERAFNNWERSAIVTTTLQTEGENDTRDQVFCLTAKDVENYYWGRATLSRCKPTDRACCKGVEWIDDDMLAHEPEVVLDNRTKSASWWLRGHRCGYGADDNSRAVFVNATGGVNSMGAPIDSRSVGVRPAMWVSAEAQKDDS